MQVKNPPHRLIAGDGRDTGAGTERTAPQILFSLASPVPLQARLAVGLLLRLAAGSPVPLQARLAAGSPLRQATAPARRGA